MALGSTSVVAPVTLGSKPSGWQTYAKRIFLITTATAAVICIGLVVSERKQSSKGDALGGAYYAVTKPPAFNFNRAFRQPLFFFSFVIVLVVFWALIASRN
jgi:hypothetical protein